MYLDGLETIEEKVSNISWQTAAMLERYVEMKVERLRKLNRDASRGKTNEYGNEIWIQISPNCCSAGRIFFNRQSCWGGAADGSEDVINYAYSSWIGSGFYSVADRTVYLLRGPFSYTLREADGENWGLSLLFPATIGFHDHSDGEDNQATFTFVPGVRFDFPVLDNWWLKPFGQFGFGKDFSGSDVAWIYGVGIKSLATFEINNSELDFGTAFTKADQSQSGGGSDSGFSMVDIGLNSRWPTNITLFDRKSDLNLYFVYTEFVNDLNFERAKKDNKTINRLYKFGIALSSEEKYPVLGLFDLRGGGIDVTFGDGYFGMGLTTGFPF